MPAWDFGDQLSTNRSTEAEPDAASDQCSCGLAGHDGAYNEEAFHFLLGVERKRFDHSNRPFVLMLVELEERSGQTAHIEAAIGARVFAGLTRSLRETDVIGWYREGFIAGAVLTHLGDASLADVSRQMAERVTRMLGDDLPEKIARRLKVRLYQPLASVQP